MGGRTVSYAQALAQLLDQSRQWPAPSRSPDWATFARRPTRDGFVPEPLTVADQPAWTVDLQALFDRTQPVTRTACRIRAASLTPLPRQLPVCTSTIPWWSAMGC